MGDSNPPVLGNKETARGTVGYSEADGGYIAELDDKRVLGVFSTADAAQAALNETAAARFGRVSTV